MDKLHIESSRSVGGTIAGASVDNTANPDVPVKFQHEKAATAIRDAVPEPLTDHTAVLYVLKT
jgi:hypothetical protein